MLRARPTDPKNFSQQNVRLAFIDCWIIKVGTLCRRDIAEKCGQSLCQAGEDIDLFERLYPDRLAYDRSAKRWVRARPDDLRPRTKTGRRILSGTPDPFGWGLFPSGDGSTDDP